MSKNERGFVPLHQVESDRLQVQATLPYVDPNEIGINVGKIERLMGLAGLATLKITAGEGDVSSSTPVVAGHTPNGEAFAGRIATKTKAKIHTLELYKPDETCVIHGFNWGDAVINLNISEISDRIMHDGNIRSPELWSRYLNKATRNGLAEAGSGHLTMGWKKDALQYDGIVLITSVGPYAAWGIPGLLAGGLIMEAFVNILWPYVHTGTPQDCKSSHERLRPSLFVGPHFERAAALQVATRFATLVKPVNSD